MSCVLKRAVTFVLLTCCGCVAGPEQFRQRMNLEGAAVLLPELESRARMFPDDPNWEAVALQALYQVEGVSLLLCRRIEEMDGMPVTISAPVDAGTCYLQLARSSRSLRHFEQAASYYERVSLVSRTSAEKLEVSRYLFLFHVRQQNWPEAHSWGLLALAESASDAELHLQMGQVLEQQGRFQEAMTEYELAQSLQPGIGSAADKIIRLRGRIEARGVQNREQIEKIEVQRDTHAVVKMEAWQPQIAMQRLDIGSAPKASTSNVEVTWIKLVPPAGMSETDMKQSLLELVAEGKTCNYKGEPLRAFLDRGGILQVRQEGSSDPMLSCLNQRFRLGVKAVLVGGYAVLKFAFTRAMR